LKNKTKLFDNFYNGKIVLITGHTGFQGSWLSIWLRMLGAKVIGYGLEPYTNKDNFVVSDLKNKIINIIGDLRDYDLLSETINQYQPEIVFHLGAQSLVLESYETPKETYDINVGGTVNLFESCRLAGSVKTIINVTSDKCYQNNEWIWPYREIDPIGGFDPYSSSKGCSEIVANAYMQSFFQSGNDRGLNIGIASARAGNVIGGGDWHTNNLIASCIISLEKKMPIILRNPKAIRPWQHVLDAISGYLVLGYKLFENPKEISGAWNFGPNNEMIAEVDVVTKKLLKYYGQNDYKIISEKTIYHEANNLQIDSTKARKILNWKPFWSLDEILKTTVDWYRNYNDDNIYDFCKQQINLYESKI
jgi:CDP-glucose 4,6-dehydratase